MLSHHVFATISNFASEYTMHRSDFCLGKTAPSRKFLKSRGTLYSNSLISHNAVAAHAHRPPCYNGGLYNIVVFLQFPYLFLMRFLIFSSVRSVCSQIHCCGSLHLARPHRHSWSPVPIICSPEVPKHLILCNVAALAAPITLDLI